MAGGIWSALLLLAIVLWVVVAVVTLSLLYALGQRIGAARTVSRRDRSGD